MGMACFPAEAPKTGAHKIGAAISGPRIAGGKITEMSFCLKNVVLAAVWRCVSRIALRTPRSIGVTFPRSTLQRQPRLLLREEGQQCAN